MNYDDNLYQDRNSLEKTTNTTKDIYQLHQTKHPKDIVFSEESMLSGTLIGMRKNNNTMNPMSIQNLLNPRSVSNSRNVHQVERDWLSRYQKEKSRHRNNERELKHRIEKLNKDIKNLQFNKDNEIQKIIDIKKGNQDLRKKMSEIIIQNSHLKQMNEKSEFSIINKQQ